MAPSKVTVLISGGGTNLQAIIDAVASGRMADTQIINVISNRKEAGGLKRAERAGIPTIYHNLLKYKKDHPDLDQQAAREGYDAELAQIILENKPDLIVCAGWMHILAPSFLNPLAAAGIDTINLHPALYGTFDGAGAIQRAYEAFQEGKIEKTGVMIHYVIAEVDRGTPILQVEVPLRHGESLDELTERIHGVEHDAIVEGAIEAIKKIRSIRA